MLSELQKKTAQAIVNVFETGRARGDYAQVTLLPGDPGHLTYGRSQTTLASGNLHLLIKAYCEAPNASRAEVLRPYLDRLAAIDFSLDRDPPFRAALKEAGGDPVMENAQDGFFDRAYWAPAARAAGAFGFSTALAAAVIYDSHVHGSWSALRDRTSRVHGDPEKAGERPWIAAYVAERREWLATHPNALLRRTVYRMDAFEAVIKAGNWPLDLPLRVCGVSIDEAALSCPRPNCS
ncbi:MAG: chitosanase [Parvibaculum sedimenti]|uniref:chitosanase n=1 Tax=Parvibaculum sedimenti TaxID=2608632 RepID=UPI003BB7038F